VVTSSPARTVGLVSQLRQLLVEIPDRGFLLFQQIGDERLLAVLDGLFLSENFLNVGSAALFRQCASLFYGRALTPRKSRSQLTSSNW
jgi:hypothetical protein